MEGTDPIADMLTRIRNALLVHHESVVMPASQMKLAIASILKQEGFVQDYQVLRNPPQRNLKLNLKYVEGRTPAIVRLERVSKPGRRIYVGKAELPRPQRDLRVAILSTSQGVMTSRDAWRRNLGGELLCYIW
ncbi:MAG: 30S ribosomal protein S8 [Chloroflexi bacterium]|nr:30S ribosomal protein S8 [Chloroflexota bacterium]